MLVDTGASKSCISEKFFQHIRRTLVIHSKISPSEPTHLLTADVAAYLTVVGTTDLKINISGVVFDHKFLIIRGLSNSVILGKDFLDANEADISCWQHCLYLQRGLIATPIVSEEEFRFNTVSTVSTVRIPPLHEALIPVRCFARNNNVVAITQPMPYMAERCIGVAKCLVQPANNATVCRIVNMSHVQRTVAKGTV